MSDKHRWRIATATAPGSSHLRDALPNQDAVACRLVEVGTGETIVAPVATIVDGINRQPAAAFGERLAEALARDAVRQARIAVERYGLRHNVPVRELASTLIVALAIAARAG